MEFVKSRALSSWDLFTRHRLSIFCLQLRNPFSRIRFLYTDRILRIKFLLGRISSFIQLPIFFFFFFFFFLFSKESVLGLLDIEPTTYVFLPLLYTLITSGGYLFRPMVYNFSIWIDVRIEFALLLKSCCWILS